MARKTKRGDGVVLPSALIGNGGAEAASSSSVDRGLFVVGALVALAVGAAVGWIARGGEVRVENTVQSGLARRLITNEYKFIEPLLGCETEPQETRAIVSLKEEIGRFVAQEANAGRVTRMSIYFSDLKTGRWTDYNERERYAIGSFNKLPELFAVLKLARENRPLLDRRLRVPSRLADATGLSFPPSQSLQPGAEYTVDALLEAMITRSDNDAFFLLAETFGKKPFDEVYRDLGQWEPPVERDNDSVTVAAYPDFFRTLYNGTYLGRKLSEKALEILSKSEFKIGLVAGVPPGTLVAHKFAERGSVPPHGGDELHDCGIVYFPDHPYVLCVMSHGPNRLKMPLSIAGVSRVVYGWVQQHVSVLTSD